MMVTMNDRVVRGSGVGPIDADAQPFPSHPSFTLEDLLAFVHIRRFLGILLTLEYFFWHLFNIRRAFWHF